MMLRSLLKGLEWSDLRDYISPAFFEVMPSRQIRRKLTSLTGKRLSNPDADRRRLAQNVPDHISVEASLTASSPTDEAARRAHGQRVLELYFHQLYNHPIAFMDLRQERFTATHQTSRWAPGWMRVEWDPQFLADIRLLYLGYYSGEMGDFDRAVARLSLQPARDVFLEHFGPGDQRSVSFQRARFHHTFHEAFMSCASQGVRLHGDFISLGIYLACLYEHLESLELAFDVRDAFRNATKNIA